MGDYRIRVKIGNAEFEAEGPEESVKEQFEAFKQLLQLTVPRVIDPTTVISTSPSQAQQRVPESPDQERLRVLFLFSKTGDFISLAFRPQGDNLQQRALLLILYGFRRLLGQEDVPVGTLKRSLEQSGFYVGRVDRIAMPLVKEGLVLKGGKKGKGGKYKLTNLGLTATDAEVRSLLGQSE